MILSICIPTYNHAKMLNRVLDNLISLPVFDENDRWEIVVSDNASADETQTVSENYAHRFPGRIRYFRNRENILDRNFHRVLSLGRGRYLKLSNDSLLWTDCGIRTMLNKIASCPDERSHLYFKLDGNAHGRETVCQTLNEFLDVASYNITWIAEFGIWKTDLARLDDFARAAATQLIQTDVTLRLLQNNRQTTVISDDFFSLAPRGAIGGYNIAKVFGHNYLSLLKTQVANGNLTPRSFALEKKRILLRHIFVYSILLRPDIRFERRGYIRHLFPDYKFNWYFYLTIPFAFAARWIDCIGDPFKSFMWKFEKRFSHTRN